MIIQGKMGSHSQQQLRVKGKRKPPEVGEKIEVKPNEVHGAKWEKCIVEEVRELPTGPLYFLSLF